MMCVERLKAAISRHALVAGLRSLACDRDGSALLYTTVSLPVLFGFALLAIDGSRYMNLHSTLQHGADALALAAAGELNKKPDALTRAKLAIDEELVNNRQRFGDDGGAVLQPGDVRVRFLEFLPASDATPLPPWGDYSSTGCTNCVIAYWDKPAELSDATLAAKARFAEVQILPQGLTAYFYVASFIEAGTNAVTASATAVAGYQKGVCFFTPIMMCNPFEPWEFDGDDTTPGIYEAAELPEWRGKMIELRQVGGGADYGPGNFAFLRHEAIGNGADKLRDALAMVDPLTCFSDDGVDTEPGQAMGPVHQGFNVRFDIYAPPLTSKKSDPQFRPARNVRKGNSGTACTYTQASDRLNYQRLPRDNTLYQDLGGGRMYAGDWDFDNYWAVNFDHNNDGNTEIDPPNGWNNTTNRPTRYEVYRHEIDNSPPQPSYQEVLRQWGEGRAAVL